jgi:hypothetical protein
MSKHRFSPNGQLNQAYRMGGLILAFPAANQAVAVAGHRKMSQRTPRADFLKLPAVTEQEGPLAEEPQRLYLALKKRYPECKICVVQEVPAGGRRVGQQHYPGHALLRRVCQFLNDPSLMPLAFAASDYASDAERTRRTREEWVALDELGRRYGLH